MLLANKNINFYIIIPLLLFILDQITKYCIIVYLDRHDIIFITSFLNIVKVLNYGMVFGLMPGLNLWILLICFSIIIVFIIIACYKEVNKINQLFLLFIIFGAIANCIDRMMYGAVVDFIDVVIFNWHFWTFNIADIMINVGVLLYLLNYFNIFDNNSKIISTK